MSNPRDLNNNPKEYVFLEDYMSPNFENAPIVKAGSTLKQCNDGWWQIFNPDGTKAEGRQSDSFVNNSKILKDLHIKKTPDELFREKQASMSDEDLLNLCREHVSKMCKSGGSSFTMCVPPSINDTDMSLTELFNRYEKAITEPKNPLKNENGELYDLSEFTPEQKAKVNEAWCKIAGSLAMETFYALGLKTHMEADMVNDGNGDVFKLSFIKINNNPKPYKPQMVKVNSGDNIFVGSITGVNWDLDQWAFMVNGEWFCQSEITPI